jgi:nucleoside-diphosphate-sugar epimerase
MPDALIGYTGFVGGALLRQRPFDELYNSKNVEEIVGKSFDLLVISAMPAAKWIANRDPAGDRATLDRLTGCLRRTAARQVVVMSTVDVYPAPIGVDEDSPIDPAAQQPYGRHRFELERTIAGQFSRSLAVRLPGLFGEGLKKNVIYDLLRSNAVDQIHADSVFQFYNLDHVWRDVETARAAALSVVNFATEPVNVRELAREAFGRDFHNRTVQSPARYDMRSKHAELLGGTDGYLYLRSQILGEIRQFVDRRKAAGP